MIIDNYRFSEEVKGANVKQFSPYVVSDVSRLPVVVLAIRDSGLADSGPLGLPLAGRVTPCPTLGDPHVQIQNLGAGQSPPFGGRPHRSAAVTGSPGDTYGNRGPTLAVTRAGKGAGE